MLVFILFLSVLFLIYGLYRRRFSYWKKKGVEGPKPVLVLGNLNRLFKHNLSMGPFFEGLYNETKHLPYVGIYMMHRPCLMLNDLDLIRNVLIKDFSHFVNRPIQFDRKTQPLADNLFANVNQRWKFIRNKLTPVFTSNKIRYMFDLMLRCGEELEDYIDSVSGDVDIKDVSAKYTTDAIGSCAFGIETNCFKYPDAEFRVLGRRAADFGFRRNATIFLKLCAPDIHNIINSRFIEDDISDYFIKIVKDTMKYREDNNISRNDVMQLLIRLKNKQSIDDSDVSKNTELSDESFDELDVAAQCFTFFFAGFDTTSSVLSFVFYELSRNPDVQQKVYEEMIKILKQNDGKITYDGLNEMIYTTQVIEETMRIYTTVPQSLRVCNKDYLIPGTTVVIEKGTPIFIPVQGIHKDSRHYPNPEVFNPENFSAENKAQRNSVAFLAFGEGPRICIGMRFAMVQIKIAMVSLLRKYKVKPSSNEAGNKIKFNAIFLSPDISLRFSKRK